MPTNLADVQRPLPPETNVAGGQPTAIFHNSPGSARVNHFIAECAKKNTHSIGCSTVTVLATKIVAKNPVAKTRSPLQKN